MTTPFAIAGALAQLAARITTANGFNTDAGLNLHRNLTVFSATDPHPLVMVVYAGDDKVHEYPGQVRQECAGEFQLTMEFAVDPVDDLSAAAAASADLTRAVFGADSPNTLRALVTSVEFSGRTHVPRLPGGRFGQLTLHVLVRWIESVGQE